MNAKYTVFKITASLNCIKKLPNSVFFCCKKSQIIYFIIQNDQWTHIFSEADKGKQ